MRRKAILLTVLAATLGAGEALVADHRAVPLADALPDSALEQVRARKVALLSPPGRSPLVGGLQELAKADARYQLRTERAPMGSWYKGGGFGQHQSSTSMRADTQVREFGKAVDKVADQVDVASMHLSTSDLPDNGRIEVPYRAFSAGMEINVSSVDNGGSYTDTITGRQVINGNGATGFGPPVSFPIELPNVGIKGLHTQSWVPAGSAADDPGWQVSDSRSPRDPRRAWDDYRKGMEGLAANHPKLALVWTTMPLAKDGNIQRNLFNQWVRDYCQRNGKNLLDIADIQATDAEGNMAWDRQGTRLAESWHQADAGRDVMTVASTQRVAKAWWWLNARMAGWQPVSAANEMPN